MSRSGYVEDEDYPGQFAMWRGQVTSAIRGQRGQKLLREMRDALDAMPAKRLIREELRADGEVCALGCLGAVRGVNLEALDPYDHETLASTFDVARQLVQEIEFVNDDDGWYHNETPEQRWQRVREWVNKMITTPEHAP